MNEKRFFPLNNPSSEKSAVDTVRLTKLAKVNVVNDDERRKGVSKGGKGRVQPAEALLRCSMCGRVQKIVFGYPNPPEWHRCSWCHELQPVDGYRVVGYGLGIPQPLAPFQVEQRAREAALTAEYNPHP